MPSPGQESVWDYPRPPRVEPTSAHIHIEFNRVSIVDTYRALRVLETSHPPVYYIPIEDIQMHYLDASGQVTFCEWKGRATYFSIQVDEEMVQDVAWGFPDPPRQGPDLRHHLAFYASKMDACYVDEMRVTPQPGNFYGGWITENIVGPFKGGPGTWGW